MGAAQFVKGALGLFGAMGGAVETPAAAHRTTMGVTPEHEVYTEAQGWRYVSELETSASLVDANGAPLTIVAIDIDPTRRPVYNLETSCGTYFAQGVWAWKRLGRVGYAKRTHHSRDNGQWWVSLRVTHPTGLGE